MGRKKYATLLPTARSNGGREHKTAAYQLKNRYCVRSKPACLILLWNFSILSLYYIGYDKMTFLQFTKNIFPLIFYNVTYSTIAVFAPMAGLLTDVKFSRYKALLCSSYSILLQGILILILTIPGGIVIFHKGKENLIEDPFIIVGLVCALILLVTLVAFQINGLQFGMDQLHDSPTEDSILYIHWYVWIQYVSVLLAQTTLNLIFHDAHNLSYIDNLRTSGLSLVAVLLLTTASTMIVSLAVIQSQKKWFHIQPAGFNPYKLVGRVVRFAYQHKVPLKRSAFTYTGEEFPSRMDLGKQKYGGPFTTKDVEDVKAFWGILKVITCMGPTFMLQTVIQPMLVTFSKHNLIYYSHTVKNHETAIFEVHIEGVARHILLSNGLLSPLLVVLCIPLYLFLIRPQIKFHIPGMLKRIGLGILLMILSLLCALSMDIVVHQKGDVGCMFSINFNNSSVTKNSDLNMPPLYMNVYFLVVEHTLSALVNMLIDIAILEFICSQSPYTMKGLLLGSFFSIKSLFQGITILSPYTLHWMSYLSCGSVFYIMAIVVGIAELIAFTYVAKKYRYRTIDEPSNEYRYAEEYYSNIQ